jgi:predicted CopG family antitoxin
MYTYIVMGTKTISITDEAYEALVNEKINRESFTETILRITKKKGKLSESFGKWKMTDKEEETFKSELSKGWQAAKERLCNEVSGY